MDHLFTNKMIPTQYSTGVNENRPFLCQCVNEIFNPGFAKRRKYMHSYLPRQWEMLRNKVQLHHTFNHVYLNVNSIITYLTLKYCNLSLELK